MAKNMPTLEELKSYYDSEQYLNMLNEFANRSKRELGSREFDMFRLFFKLTYCQRRYMVLDVPFDEVLSVIEDNKDTFLGYQVAVAEYFNEQDIDTTYLIEKFCEFYLLQAADKNRLLHYLIIVKSEISFQHRNYTKQITELYNQAISNTICS